MHSEGHHRGAHAGRCGDIRHEGHELSSRSTPVRAATRQPWRLDHVVAALHNNIPGAYLLSKSHYCRKQGQNGNFTIIIVFVSVFTDDSYCYIKPFYALHKIIILLNQ